MMSTILGIARITLGLTLLAGVFWFGWAGTSPTWILALAAVFTINFGLGRWRAWTQAYKDKAIHKALVAQLGTCAIQSILVSLFFFAGSGVGAIWSPAQLPTETSTFFIIFSFFTISLGLAIALGEHFGPGDPIQVAQRNIDEMTKTIYTPQTNSSPPLRTAPDVTWNPVKIDKTFFQAAHYSQGDNASMATDEDISAVEGKLGVKLPPTLKQLYKIQSGGSSMDLWVPCQRDHFQAELGHINVFPGYDDMLPLDHIHTLKDNFENWANFETEPEEFPVDSHKIIVLAQYYRHTLFLDARGPGAPKVGFTDFDNTPDHTSSGGWETHDETFWWNSFDDFVADLRRPVPPSYEW